MSALAQRPIRPADKHVLWLCLSLLVVVRCSPSTPPANNTNNPPVVKAGADQVVDAGASVTLDGSASSDPDGNAISFFWKQTLGTPVSLSSTSASVATFTAPANGTSLTFELTVSDGQSNSVAKVNISVRPVEPLAQITETHQPSTRDDPAVTGNFPDGWTIAGLPSGPLGTPNPGETGAPDGVEKINYAPLAEVELAPGATQEVDLQAAGPSLLIGSAKWIGTTDSLSVTLGFNGASVATGDGFSIGTDRGGSVVRAQTTAGGQVSLLVANTSAVKVKVRIILGAFAL
jgi:hypothetical protein